MRTSEIDAAVALCLEHSQHDWETLTVDGATGEYCRHCGRSKDECRKPDSYEFLKCRGLIG